MELSKDLKKILVAGAALLMTASVIGTGNVANAKHRRYYYRTHRVYRRHARRHYRRARKHYRKARHYYRRAHRKYVWMLFGENPTRVKRLIVTKIKGNEYYTKISARAHTIIAERWQLYLTRATAVRANKANNKVSHYHRSHQSKSHKHKSQRVQRNVQENENQIKNQLIKDINNDRKAKGLSPLTESSKLDTIANIRAQQLYKYGVKHVDSNGNGYYDQLRKEYNFQPNFVNGTAWWGENCASTALGQGYYRKVGYLPNNNGDEMANNAEYNMMYHDAPSGWGHRKAVLDSRNNQVGIGSYTPDGTEYYLSEDFSS